MIKAKGKNERKTCNSCGNIVSKTNYYLKHRDGSCIISSKAKYFIHPAKNKYSLLPQHEQSSSSTQAQHHQQYQPVTEGSDVQPNVLIEENSKELGSVSLENNDQDSGEYRSIYNYLAILIFYGIYHIFFIAYSPYVL